MSREIDFGHHSRVRTMDLSICATLGLASGTGYAGVPYRLRQRGLYYMSIYRRAW